MVPSTRTVGNGSLHRRRLHLGRIEAEPVEPRLLCERPLCGTKSGLVCVSRAPAVAWQGDLRQSLSPAATNTPRISLVRAKANASRPASGRCPSSFGYGAFQYAVNPPSSSRIWPVI
jgi:hypothetical protein